MFCVCKTQNATAIESRAKSHYHMKTEKEQKKENFPKSSPKGTAKKVQMVQGIMQAKRILFPKHRYLIIILGIQLHCAQSIERAGPGLRVIAKLAKKLRHSPHTKLPMSLSLSCSLARSSVRLWFVSYSPTRRARISTGDTTNSKSHAKELIRVKFQKIELKARVIRAQAPHRQQTNKKPKPMMSLLLRYCL